MNLHAEKTEVLLDLCKKNGIELSAKPTRNEMLKKLTELEQDPLAGGEEDLEEPTKVLTPKPVEKLKQVKPLKGPQPHQEYKLRIVARGSERALEGKHADLSVPYAYDEEGYPSKFVHCAFDQKVKVTKISIEQAATLNAHAHTSLRYFQLIGE